MQEYSIIVRGGSCDGVSRFLRCASRNWSLPLVDSINLGFRIVMGVKNARKS